MSPTAADQVCAMRQLLHSRASRLTSLFSTLAGGGINMPVLWYIIYCTLAVLVCCIIPFAFFYYESSSDE